MEILAEDTQPTLIFVESQSQETQSQGIIDETQQIASPADATLSDVEVATLPDNEVASPSDDEVATLPDD